MNNGGVQLNKYTTQAQKGTTMQKPLIYVAGPYRDPRCCDRRDNRIPAGQQPRVGMKLGFKTATPLQNSNGVAVFGFLGVTGVTALQICNSCNVT